ncbi:hypothetical protein EVAR_39539_1 [Eumeta japonica]|uniref:Uncharacterized protein n=1 Tax=Eumeta variegata TaxID=151549 RepID=A0A4C1XNP3_EUMVA|nr:hypothetical protein EVAR_39539_1 [Eumeta japonica]
MVEQQARSIEKDSSKKEKGMAGDGLAYRAATGCCLVPRSVVNGLALAKDYACETREAMSGVLRVLCPDDDPGRDTEYHSLVWVAAATTPSDRDAAPLGGVELRRIIGSLPHTARDFHWLSRFSLPQGAPKRSGAAHEGDGLYRVP